jgi:ABC-2 type transport system permease protein
MAVVLSAAPPGALPLWQRLWRQFRTASILGWKIESNWADPFIFAIYTLIRPLAGAFILVFMYLVVVQGSTSNPYFAHMFVGNAFFMYVARVMMGISYAIIDDREHYEMLKYIYISPLQILLFLFGRGMANIITTSISVVITLLIGIWPLGIQLSWGQVNWGLLFPSFLVGLLALIFVGFLLAGTCLLLARHAWAISEGVAGVLYLVCGAVFPLDVLPLWIQAISYLFPLTYWLELMRRVMLGSSFSGSLAGFSDWGLFFLLAGVTALWGVASILLFRRFDGLARRRGLIDQTSGY